MKNVQYHVLMVIFVAIFFFVSFPLMIITKIKSLIKIHYLFFLNL